jgi:hypothetical protein
MFSLAIKWQWRTDNPAKGIERNSEEKRHRYLSGDEMEPPDGRHCRARRPAGGEHHPVASADWGKTW